MEQNRFHDNQHVFDGQSQKYRLGLWLWAVVRIIRKIHRSLLTTLVCRKDLEIMLNPPGFLDCRIWKRLWFDSDEVEYLDDRFPAVGEPAHLKSHLSQLSRQITPPNKDGHTPPPTKPRKSRETPSDVPTAFRRSQTQGYMPGCWHYTDQRCLENRPILSLDGLVEGPPATSGLSDVLEHSSLRAKSHIADSHGLLSKFASMPALRTPEIVHGYSADELPYWTDTKALDMEPAPAEYLYPQSFDGDPQLHTFGKGQ
ncbi:hypothetical protein BJ166DRAFT_12216 [Pestalotiopsis sp. NC0098]|nr:hypothetical protein BJ166DRAFT_12216 [Pestalotiopsis sp. NC0098]